MQINLSNIEARPRCSKPHCRTGCTAIRRHHKRSQHMWLKHFAWHRKHKAKRRKYLNFKRRYWDFQARDIVHLCADHHEEIHTIYWPTIGEFLKRVRKPLRECTWREANCLMNELERTCNEWLKLDTPGIRTRKYTS